MITQGTEEGLDLWDTYISKVVCKFNITQFSTFYSIITTKREAK